MKCKICNREIKERNGIWRTDESPWYFCSDDIDSLQRHEPEPTEATPSRQIYGEDFVATLRKSEREAVVGGQPEKITLSESEHLSMFRNAFYSAMGIHNYANKPTDSECLRWLAKVRIHAEKLQNFPMQLPAIGGLPYWKKWIEE